jgi:hypothetical protein
VAEACSGELPKFHFEFDSLDEMGEQIGWRFLTGRKERVSASPLHPMPLMKYILASSSIEIGEKRRYQIITFLAHRKRKTEADLEEL